MSLLDNFFPNKFSTIFEVDYDTPYRYFVGQDTTMNTIINSPAVRHHASVNVSTPKIKPAPFSVMESPNTSSVGLVNNAFEDDEDDDKNKDYGTIVNGKRAVSLKNFGKFAQKEAGRKKQLSYMQRKINSFSGPHTLSRGRDVNIDMRSSAAMW